MSLLDGLAGVGIGLAGAGSAISAQKQADQLERELAIREAQEGRAAVQERERLDIDAANTNVRMFKNAGILNDGLDRIDRNRAVAKLEANDPVARQALLNAARTSGFIDASVKDIRFVKGPNGDWVIQTSNDDGTFGVITADGSKDPNAPVASFKSLEDFIGVANVAYNRSVVRQNEFDIAKQNTVTNALNKQFDILEQQLEEQGVPPEQQVAIKRGVAAGVANIEDPQEQAAFVEAVIQGDQPPPAESEAPRGPSQNNSGIARTARAISERGRDEAPEMTPARRAAKEAELKRAKEKRDRLNNRGGKSLQARSARTAAESDVARLEKELGIVKDEPETFTMDTPEDQEAMNQVAEQTEGLPVSEVAAKVASGEITVTPAQQQQVAVSLQQAGVETVSDLRNLKSDRQRALAIASMISAFKGNEATQSALLKQISNVLETGTTSMSAADAATLGVQRQNAELRAAELRRALANDLKADMQAAGTAGTEMLRAWGEIKDTGEGDSFKDAMRFLNTEAAPYLNDYLNAPGYVKSAYIRALNPVVSEILAAYAAQEEGGLSETFLSIFRSDIDRENVSKTDFDLSRVKGNFTNDNPPKLRGFWFTDSDGMKLDESVDAKTIQDQDQTLYDILVMAAVANRGRG